MSVGWLWLRAIGGASMAKKLNKIGNLGQSAPRASSSRRAKSRRSSIDMCSDSRRCCTDSESLQGAGNNPNSELATARPAAQAADMGHCRGRQSSLQARCGAPFFEHPPVPTLL